MPTVQWFGYGIPTIREQYSWPLGLKNSRQEAEEDLEFGSPRKVAREASTRQLYREGAEAEKREEAGSPLAERPKSRL